MIHFPTYPDDLPNSSTRPGSKYQALSEANQRLQLFADSSGALDSHFHGPPPPYRSRSMAPVDEGLNEVTGVTEDSPELLRKLEENARMLPFLWKEYQDKAFAALPQKEKQKLMDERAALRKLAEARERRDEEVVDRLLSALAKAGNPDFLFTDPKNKKQPARSVSPNLDHPTPTETQKREREIKNNMDFLALSDSRDPESQASECARTRGVNMQLGLEQNEPVQDSVRSDEKIPLVKAISEPPSAPSSSSPKRFTRKPRTARVATKVKALTEIPEHRSARIEATRSRTTEPLKPITSYTGGRKRKNK